MGFTEWTKSVPRRCLGRRGLALEQLITRAARRFTDHRWTSSDRHSSAICHPRRVSTLHYWWLVLKAEQYSGVTALALAEKYLDPDAADLIGRHFFAGAVVQFSGTGRFMVGNGLRVFQRAAVFEIGRYAGGSKRVATGGVGQGGDRRSPLDHMQHVKARQTPFRLDGYLCPHCGTGLPFFPARGRRRQSSC